MRRPLPIVALACALAALAAAPGRAEGIRVTVDRTEITVEEQFVLRVVVEGSRSAVPELPELPDFDVFAGGQSTQVSLVNGVASSSVTYTYGLLPKRSGEFVIGEATVTLDDRVYTSRPFTVRVLEASARPQASRDLFTTVRVSTTTPYVGQQVIYTWRLYRRVRISDARLEPQDFSGLLAEDLGEVSEFEATVGGQAYLVSQIRKALFPQEEGTVTVPASRLTCQVVVQEPRRQRGLFDDFFGRRTETRNLRTEPVELEVRPLPPAPTDFSGLVGKFGIRGELSRDELAVGESATLEISVRGSGNVQMIGEPELPPLPSFKLYADQPVTSIDRSGSELSGSRTFRKALVPLEPGELVIPALELTYFDPETGTYETAASAPIELVVSPGDGPEDLALTEFLDPAAGKVPVRILADDVLPLYKGVDVVYARGAGSRPMLFGTLALLLTPPLVYLGAALVERRRRRFAEDTRLERRQGARKRARAALKRLAATQSEMEKIVRASRCVRDLIGDKLGLEGAALTAADAAAALAEAGSSEETIERVRELLGELEAARYGAARQGADRLVDEVAPLVARLDREL